MENIIWSVIFIVETMKYVLAEKIFFKRDIKRKWGGYVGFLVYICLVNFLQITSEEEQHIVMYTLAVTTSYIMVYEKKIEDFVHILILFVEVACIEGITEKLIIYIEQNIGVFDLLKEYQLLVNGIAVVFILFIVYTICKRRSMFAIKMDYIWILVLCMAVCILFNAAGLYVTKEYVRNQRFQSFVSITNICSYASVGVLILFITYIRNTNQRLQQLLITEKKLKEAQKHYYSSLLQREEETRKNRHDWNNHLICLAEIAQKESADNTKQYIDTLMKQNAHLKEKQYDVGNDVLNAILCCYLAELDNDISVNIVGKCKNNISIDAVDLCVIVSNLVQNAVEYLRDSNMESKKLSFCIEEGNVYKRISVVNSVDKNVSEHTIKATTKSDKRNHGIGLRNVRETIERNGGKLEINIQEGMFKAQVIWN
ncbi:MAG: GHKL domain-containing protein [Lachnospiraceae bacterium]|nr:GHKL domain-containing protein [Lachnospiraceae bacterium]